MLIADDVPGRIHDTGRGPRLERRAVHQRHEQRVVVLAPKQIAVVVAIIVRRADKARGIVDGARRPPALKAVPSIKVTNSWPSA